MGRRRRRGETREERMRRRERSIARARMGHPDWAPETPAPRELVWPCILIGGGIAAVSSVAYALVRAYVW